MNRKLLLSFLMLLLVGAAPFVGCKDQATDQPAPAAEEAAPDPLAGLSEEVRAAVLAQRICPVTEEPLGSMGAPIAVEVEGRTVYICCEHCRESLLEDPAKYFAILDGAAGGAAEDAEDAATDEAGEGAASEEADEPAADEPAADEAPEEDDASATS